MSGIKVLSRCLLSPSRRRLFKSLQQERSQFIKMLSTTDHLTRTASSSRSNTYHIGAVVDMKEDSQTVKSFKIHVSDKRFSFKAGQWVDVVIPQFSIVGGFSITSSPRQLRKDANFDLAVKYSEHPPAKWFHEQCRDGTMIMVRSGGDVYYDTDHLDVKHDLLLIAGGIGINPLFGILNHINDLMNIDDLYLTKPRHPDRVQILYSAVTKDELIFKEDIKEIMDSHKDNIHCQFHVTKESASNNIKEGRINLEDIKETFKWLDKDCTKTFICGPPPMIEDMYKLLKEFGLDVNNIFYEKWW